MDIEAWLEGLGLERYVPAFRDNEIDWEVLPKLTSEDLREIGVAAIGHRRKLLDAIATLSASEPTSAVTAAASNDAERRQLTAMFCAIWSARRRSRRGSTPRIYANSSASITARSLRRSAGSPVSSPSIWGMGC